MAAIHQDPLIGAPEPKRARTPHEGPSALVAARAAAEVDRVADSQPKSESGEYDYVVVGAGAGGAIVASRLAEAGHKVLVVEAGSDARPVETEVPAFHAAASEHSPVALDYCARHYADEAIAERPRP